MIHEKYFEPGKSGNIHKVVLLQYFVWRDFIFGLFVIGQLDISSPGLFEMGEVFDYF